MKTKEVMMEDQEEKFSLRDKFAIEILQALINRLPAKDFDLIKSFTEHWHLTDTKNADIAKYYCERMDHLIRTAYKIADLMRENRLSAFK